MPVFVCQDHYDLYMSHLPRHVRRAMNTVVKRTGSLVVVSKETCQVCMGLFQRELSPVVLCRDHLREFYMHQPEAALRDPSFTLRYVRPPGSIEDEKRECVQCKTGKPPD
jgi:hypothetical protein